MSNGNNECVKPPNNLDLPFFAYGIFKPGQLAYSKIENHVKKYYKSEIQYEMLMRDGVPLIKHINKGKSKTKGYLIYFKEDSSKEAYKIISETESEKLYGWKEIGVNGNKANVLMGVNPELGSSYFESEIGDYDGREDPFFKDALDVIEQELNDESKRWNDTGDFFKLQMAYMLLWASIERYCGLKYANKGSKVNKLSKDNLFIKNLEKHVRDERKVYSAEDLREYTLNPKKPYDSIRYYYTIRCNVVHRGKAMHADEYMLRHSLTELLNIFKDILSETFYESIHEN